MTKITKLHENYRSIQKSKFNRYVTQIKNETIFKESLDTLFGIAHMNALQLIRIEDKSFLQAQREKGRRGYIGR